jgi:hypothetical protein
LDARAASTCPYTCNTSACQTFVQGLGSIPLDDCCAYYGYYGATPSQLPFLDQWGTATGLRHSDGTWPDVNAICANLSNQPCAPAGVAVGANGPCCSGLTVQNGVCASGSPPPPGGSDTLLLAAGAVGLGVLGYLALSGRLGGGV